MRSDAACHAAAPPSADPPLNAMLIVKDSVPERARLAAMAKALGVAAVHEAASGHQALQWLEPGRLPETPAAMLLDLELSEMDGITLIEQLHARGVRIPLALMSGQGASLLQSVGYMVEQLGLPLLGVLPQPMDAPALARVLQRACGPAPWHRARADDAPKAQGPTGTELALAIASGQIQAHYQPKVSFADGGLSGVETLARWTHPTLGNIPPDVFIPLAERMGLIHALTLSVLEQSLRQLAAWNAQGLRLKLAVNLSPRVLEARGLVEQIVHLQKKHGAAPSQITLEITESASAYQFVSAIGMLARLRLKGFGLSIDDYGTGYSSMQQLAKIPFTELKFDRSFVQGAVRHENYRVILSTSIQMCQKLGLSTVAEGVETQAEWDLLRDYGCLMGQGWFIARPMPADALTDWMQARRRHPAGQGSAAGPLNPHPSPARAACA